MGITYFKIISEDIIEAYLQGRDTCTFYFTLLKVYKIILAVTGYIPQFIKFLTDSGCNHITFSQSGSCIRMHSLSQVIQQSAAVTHGFHHVVKCIDTFSKA